MEKTPRAEEKARRTKRPVVKFGSMTPVTKLSMLGGRLCLVATAQASTVMTTPAAIKVRVVMPRPILRNLSMKIKTGAGIIAKTSSGIFSVVVAIGGDNEGGGRRRRRKPAAAALW